MLKTILHKANERGHVQHGWLNAYHSFSFASYYDPNKIRFGKLRVINEDVIMPGQGFGAHPHDNMEIITIPLAGALAHKDSMGNTSVIHAGEVQVMSAGTGILHSEYNASANEPIHLLQIWVFPNKKDVEPRYQQITFDKDRVNELQQIVSPNADDEGAWIYQQAWFSLGYFKEQRAIIYPLHNVEHGVYIFVIKGQATVAGVDLASQDALGVEGGAKIDIDILQPDTQILVIEVPM